MTHGSVNIFFKLLLKNLLKILHFGTNYSHRIAHMYRILSINNKRSLLRFQSKTAPTSRGWSACGKTIPFLQVYWWQSLHFTSFHSYLYSTPSVCTQSSSRKLLGWFLAQAVKFPVPRSAQVKEPSVKISFNPSQDFAPLWRCCKNTFSSLFWTSTRTEFSCRHLSSAMVQFWQVLLVK